MDAARKEEAPDTLAGVAGAVGALGRALDSHNVAREAPSAGPSRSALYGEVTTGTDAESIAGREREAEVIEARFAEIRRDLALISQVDDEAGLRARRMVEALDGPCWPEAVHQTARAFAETLATVVYATNPARRREAQRVIEAAVALSQAQRKAA